MKHFRENLPSLPFPPRLLSATALLIFLGLAACHPPCTGGVERWKTGAAAASKAADAVIAMSGKTGGPPRQADPRAAGLLDRVFDVPEPCGASSADALAPIEAWLNASSRLGAVYLRAGLDPRDAGNPNAPPMMFGSRSVLIYGPELGRHFDATLRLADALDHALSEIESRKHGKLTPEEELRHSQISDETFEILIGTLEAMALPEVSDDWRSARMDALESAGRDSVRFLLSPQQRCMVRHVILEVRDASDGRLLKDRLARFSRRFQDPVRS